MCCLVPGTAWFSGRVVPLQRDTLMVTAIGASCCLVVNAYICCFRYYARSAVDSSISMVNAPSTFRLSCIPAEKHYAATRAAIQERRRKEGEGGGRQERGFFYSGRCKRCATHRVAHFILRYAATAVHSARRFAL